MHRKKHKNEGSPLMYFSIVKKCLDIFWWYSCVYSVDLIALSVPQVQCVVMFYLCRQTHKEKRGNKGEQKNKEDIGIQVLWFVVHTYPVSYIYRKHHIIEKMSMIFTGGIPRVNNYTQQLNKYKNSVIVCLFCEFVL